MNEKERLNQNFMKHLADREQMAQQGQCGVYAGQATAYKGANEIGEPTIINRSKELLSYLERLAALEYQIWSKLFGPRPEVGGMLPKEDREAALEEMLSRACQMAASSVGAATSILSRI